MLHHHGEGESCPFVFTFGLSTHRAATFEDYVLTDHQSKSDSLAVSFCRTQTFSKLSEDTIDVLRKDTLACVNDVNFKHLLGFIIGHNHADNAPATKLEGILHQVYENLLKSDLVSKQKFG